MSAYFIRINLNRLQSVFVGSSIVGMHKAKKALKTGFNGLLGASLDCVSCAVFRFSEVSANLRNFVK